MHRFMKTYLLSLLVFALLLPGAAFAATPWIHIEVTERGSQDTHVKVNLPLSVVKLALELAPEKLVVDGKLKLDGLDKDLDLNAIRQMWTELRNAGDSEFVTVQEEDTDVSVRIVGDQLRVNVTEKDDGGDNVDIQVPIDVVDALFSSEGDSLNLSRAIRELENQRGDIVRVQDDENTVRIWIDER